MSLISVVIPLYNKEFIIKDTLNSVLNQTFTDFEIIIINDGSTDNSENIVKTISDNRIILYNQKNKGAAAARNAGINYANSELIAFLDADDYWETNHLEELIKLRNTFPNCGAYCSLYYIQITAEKKQIPTFNGFSNDFYGIIPNYFLSNHPFKINICLNQIIPKAILLEMGCFTEGITNGQDLELWTKIAIKYPIALHNKRTATYNSYIPNTLSKNNIKSMKLMDFNQFLNEEKKNIYLKEFLDLHRISYALHYKIAGEDKIANSYLTNVNMKNIPLKTKILIKTPNYILKNLLSFKHWLRRNGVDFSVYN